MENYKIGKLKVSMPSGWHEVPYGVATEIINAPKIDRLMVLSLLSGVDEDTLSKATDQDTIYHFANAFAFVNSLPHNLEHPEMPRSMKFRDSPLIFPFVLYGDKFDLGKAEVGQIRDMTDLIVRMSKEMVGEIPEGGVQRDLTQAEQFEIVTGKQMGILRGYP